MERRKKRKVDCSRGGVNRRWVRVERVLQSVSMSILKEFWWCERVFLQCYKSVYYMKYRYIQYTVARTLLLNILCFTRMEFIVHRKTFATLVRRTIKMLFPDLAGQVKRWQAQGCSRNRSSRQSRRLCPVWSILRGLRQLHASARTPEGLQASPAQTTGDSSPPPGDACARLTVFAASSSRNQCVEDLQHQP